MFSKRKAGSGEETALRIRTAEGERNVSFRELVLSTNMSLEALLSVLIRKGIVAPEELLDEIETRKNGTRDIHGIDRASGRRDIR